VIPEKSHLKPKLIVIGIAYHQDSFSVSVCPISKSFLPKTLLKLISFFYIADSSFPSPAYRREMNHNPHISIRDVPSGECG